jgi:L-lactate dehydrogenase (cytochrome)
MLGSVAAACPSFPLMLDGGIRRGSDVLKAVALGASMVFAGRPFIYAAAVGGELMVTHAIGLLRSEVGRNMAMLGVNSLQEVVAAECMVRIAGRNSIFEKVYT